MDCIEHNQYAGKPKYGLKWYKGEAVGYHVYAYCMANGLNPLSLKGTGQVVLHKCDNPRCINPEHLELGTQASNIADMMQKGRNGNLHGEAHGSAKLTDKQVAEIRRRYTPRHPTDGCRALAREFGVSGKQVSRIVNNQRRNKE